jgi:hypothetical protein
MSSRKARRAGDDSDSSDDEEGQQLERSSYPSLSSAYRQRIQGNAEGSIFKLPFCRVLIYVFTTICLMTSTFLLINYFSYHQSTETNKPSNLDQHFHYHGLNKGEYDSLYTQAKFIIEKHRVDLQHLQKEHKETMKQKEGEAADAENEINLDVEENEEEVGSIQMRQSKLHTMNGQENPNNQKGVQELYPSTPRDMVLAMAENIDPKNFVSLKRISIC